MSRGVMVKRKSRLEPIYIINSEKVYFQLFVQCKTQVSQIMERIQEQWGIATNLQILLHKGKVLDPKDSLHYLGIKKGSTIQVINGSPVKIVIRTLQGKLIPIEAPLQTSIHQIKQILVNKWGFGLEEQQIYLDDKLCEDEETLVSLKVWRADIGLFFLKIGGAQFYIMIKILGEKVIELMCQEQTGILDIKGIMEEQEGIPISEQSLIYSGIVLENDRSLDSYYIEKGAILHLATRSLKSLPLPLKPPISDASRYSMLNSTIREDESTNIQYLHGLLDQSYGESNPPDPHNIKCGKFNLTFSEQFEPFRQIQGGLNMEGQCVNRECRAFAQKVVENKGYGWVNLRKSLPRCPLCAREVLPQNLYFCMTYYYLQGLHLTHGHISSPVDSTFDENGCVTSQILQLGSAGGTKKYPQHAIHEWKNLYVITTALQMTMNRHLEAINANTPTPC